MNIQEIQLRHIPESALRDDRRVAPRDVFAAPLSKDTPNLFVIARRIAYQTPQAQEATDTQKVVVESLFSALHENFKETKDIWRPRQEHTKQNDMYGKYHALISIYKTLWEKGYSDRQRLVGLAYTFGDKNLYARFISTSLHGWYKPSEKEASSSYFDAEYETAKRKLERALEKNPDAFHVLAQGIQKMLDREGLEDRGIEGALYADAIPQVCEKLTQNFKTCTKAALLNDFEMDSMSQSAEKVFGYLRRVAASPKNYRADEKPALPFTLTYAQQQTARGMLEHLAARSHPLAALEYAILLHHEKRTGLAAHYIHVAEKSAMNYDFKERFLNRIKSEKGKLPKVRWCGHGRHG
ncbi:MAG: hypothetical protein LBU87_05860 [Lactobacillales bacterium]|jgi:hypothetical protein|nr:hypothetical protein [Lactobacillales bacterium]